MAEGYGGLPEGYGGTPEYGRVGGAGAHIHGLDAALDACSLSAASTSAAEAVAQPEPLDEANLFVGDLAKEVNEKELRDAFSEFGQVLSVDIKRDRVTRASLGYGFVQYATRRCLDDPAPAPSPRGSEPRARMIPGRAAARGGGRRAWGPLREARALPPSPSCRGCR